MWVGGVQATSRAGLETHMVCGSEAGQGGEGTHRVGVAESIQVLRGRKHTAAGSCVERLDDVSAPPGHTESGR